METVDVSNLEISGPQCISCVAFINAANMPLYIKVYEEYVSGFKHRGDDTITIQMQKLIYSSLDIIEEKLASKTKAVDGYLGLLVAAGLNLIYATITATKQKIIVALNTTRIPEEAVKEVLKNYRIALVRVYLNPFTEFGMPLKSLKFEAMVDEISRSLVKQQ